MKTTRSFTLIMAGLLGASLLAAPLTYAAGEAPAQTAAVHVQKTTKRHHRKAKTHRQAHRHHVEKHHKTAAAFDFGANARG